VVSSPALACVVHLSPGAFAAQLVEWIRAHPWANAEEARIGLGRAHSIHVELRALVDAGTLIRDTGFDGYTNVTVRTFAVAGTPPSTPPVSQGRVVDQRDVASAPSATPFRDLDRALDLLACYEMQITEQQTEIAALRAERDEARQTLAVLKSAAVVALPLVETKPAPQPRRRLLSPLPSRPCQMCGTQFQPKTQTWRGQRPVVNCRKCTTRASHDRYSERRAAIMREADPSFSKSTGDSHAIS
jgi:hypothetical protein